MTRRDANLTSQMSVQDKTRRGPLLAVMIAVFLLVVSGQPAVSGDIHAAARKGDLTRVSALLSAGVDVNERDGSGETALHEAAKMGHLEIVRALLSAGADPLIRGQGTFGSTGTPLHLATKRGKVDVVRILLENGVDPNLHDDGVGPPLHGAIAYRRTDVETVLRSFGAGPIFESPVDDLIAAADPVAGQKIAGTCRSCHHLTKIPSDESRVGAPLWGIVGRPKASVDGYTYSNALSAAGGTWDYADLNSFLANPRGFIPGNKMPAFNGISDPRRRADLIRFLRDLSDAPRELP